MNKNDVYKLIDYHGEYNASVKKAIRKLLKENHPDNKGDRKKFELINEVKKELESGKVSYKEKDTVKDNKNIDIDYCYRMINELKIKKNSLNELINTKKELLHDYEIEYKDLYHESLNIENNLLVNPPYIRKEQNFKLFSIIILVLMIIALIISIFQNNNISFVAFIALAIICIYFVEKRLLLIHKMSENNKTKVASYIKMNNNIKKNVKKRDSLKKEINSIERKINNIENDLRFYKNQLK